MATFAGTWRDKLIAYAGLALAGSALLVIGTPVSSSTALAALVAVPATFTVLFAGGLAVRGASPTTRTPRPDQSSRLSRAGSPRNTLLAAPHRHEAAMRRAGTARE